MKRLIIIAMFSLSFLIQADDSNASSKNSTDAQSSSDVSTKKNDDVSISIANVHHINLDTTQVDGGGNWLHKRMWYERAQTIFGEIRAMLNALGDLRMQFSNEVNAVGHKIDSFYEVVNFNKKELDDKFKEILTALDTEQKIIGDLSAQERDLQTTIKQEIKVIEQIGKDIKSIGAIDNKIEETLMQTFRTIDECREYESKSWDLFKSIGKELDDKKARNLYYQINNYKQNVDQKINYLKTTLLPYLHNDLVAKIDTNIAKINQAIDALKVKGIDLQKIMSKTQEDDLTALKDREKAATEVAVRKAIEEEEKKVTQLKAQFEQELKEAQAKSYAHVMHQYYESTIGRVVGFVHQGYAGMSLDYIGSFFTSYSYPVITYLYNSVSGGIVYMQHLVTRLMIHYGGKPVIKAVIKEKIEEKIHEAQEHGQTIKDLVREKIAEKIEEKQAGSSVEKSVESKTKDINLVPATTVSSVAPISTSSNQDQVSATTGQSDDSVDLPAATVAVTTQAPVTSAPVTTPSDPVAADNVATPAQPSSDSIPQLPSADVKPADTVVVQSIVQHENIEQKQQATSGLYQVFKAFLDFIGTIFVSAYRCVVQFFILLWKFLIHVTFMN